MAMVVFPLLLLFLLPLATVQTVRFCSDSGNYTSNSTYEANLMLLSSILPKKAASNTIGTDTIGNLPDIIYGLALCHRYFDAPDCKDCLTTTFQEGMQQCPYSKDVTIYNTDCMLMNTQNFTTSVDSTRRLLFTLLSNTAQSAANSTGRFMTSRLQVSSYPTMYCLMQCPPDLPTGDCAACLQAVLQDTLRITDYKQGAMGLGTRCNMRYEIYPFFRDPMLRITNLATEVPDPVVQTTVEKQGRNSRKRAPLIVAVAALSVLLCFIGSVMSLRGRRKGKVDLRDQSALNRLEEDALVWRLEEKSSEFTLFDFSEILQATCNFSKENLLGRGGFGPVYKGQLPGGMEIAVKRLASHSGQGFTEFKNEVELIAKLQHNNLVKLLGCCIQGEEKILVYEYLPNKSLDFFIFDVNRTTLVDWNKRRVIIEGIAQGLLYLHKHSRLRIIHRDLKASNILLDQDMNPKISDFGLAKIFSSNDTQGSTKRVVGTYGYMSPEYASEGIYSIKSDVFSFGVLLLEILSGKRNSGFHQYGDFLNLLGYSWQLWEGGIWIELLEISIAKEIHTTEAKRYINIALMCVQESADDRPTMSDVVAMLNSESVILPEPNHPAYFSLRVSKVHESASVVVPCSNNDVTITAEPDGR